MESVWDRPRLNTPFRSWKAVLNGFEVCAMTDEFNFSYSLTKDNQRSMSWYHNLGPHGLHSANQYYIGLINTIYFCNIST